MLFSAISLRHQSAAHTNTKRLFVLSGQAYKKKYSRKHQQSIKKKGVEFSHFASFLQLRLLLFFFSVGCTSSGVSIFLLALANDTAEVKELWLIAAPLGLWRAGGFHFSLPGLPPDVVAFSPDPLRGV